MIIITFPDRDTEKRALAFFLGRFSGRVLSGEHLIPEAALEALGAQNVPFTVSRGQELRGTFKTTQSTPQAQALSEQDTLSEVDAQEEDLLKVPIDSRKRLNE